MLAKLLSAWSKVSKNDESLARTLRDVGYACASMEPEPLRELRNHFANAKVKSEKAEGMLIAAVEIIDGLRDARSEWLQESEPFLERRDGLHVRILGVLLEVGFATPKKLESTLKARLTDVSAALKKLQHTGHVHAPVRNELDGRQRIYSLTPRGREMANKLGLKVAPEPTDAVAPPIDSMAQHEPALRANAAGPRARSVDARTIALINRSLRPKQDVRRASDSPVIEDRHNAS